MAAMNPKVDTLQDRREVKLVVIVSIGSCRD